MNVKEKFKNYILKKVYENTTSEKPYFFIKWSGLYELARHYQLDLLQIIDELVSENRLKKALIKKKLAIYLPQYTPSKKLKQMKNEFEEFLKS